MCSGQEEEKEKKGLEKVENLPKVSEKKNNNNNGDN